MRYALEIMQKEPTTIHPDARVEALARLLLERRMDGCCVVDDAGALVGVVTSMDLVFQEKPVHLPTVLTFMDAVIALGGRRAQEELEKITGSTVRDIMSADPTTVRKDTPLSEVAALMVEKHFTILPVLDQGVLVGVITKADVLRAAFPALA
jgi:CBS domain-containing protein